MFSEVSASVLVRKYMIIEGRYRLRQLTGDLNVTVNSSN